MKLPGPAVSLLSRRAVEVGALVSVVVVTALGILAATERLTMSTLSDATDVVLKVLAVVFGATWTSNRYLVSRADEPQIRVTANLELVSGPSFSPPAGHHLLIYQLDI